MMIAVIVTLIAKGYSSYVVDRLRSELSLSRREVLNSKERLTTARQAHQDMARDNRGKENRITRLKQDVTSLQERVNSLKAAQQRASEDRREG